MSNKSEDMSMSSWEVCGVFLEIEREVPVFLDLDIETRLVPEF